MIAEIEAAVQEKANERLIETLIRALDLLEKQVDHAGCSYGAYLGLYTTLKIASHNLKKREELHLVVGADHETRLKDVQDRIEAVRVRLYQDPCKDCEVCRTRVTPWPN